MLGSIRLLFLRERLLEAMVNKFLAGMFTGLGSSLIFLGCSPSTSRPLDTTSVPWLAFHIAANGFPEFFLYAFLSVSKYFGCFCFFHSLSFFLFYITFIVSL